MQGLNNTEIGRDRVVAILFPDGAERARKVVSRSRARPTGKYPSWKMGRMIQWESPHELNAFRILDALPNVLSFQEQPAEIQFVLDGVTKRHYPDALVRTDGAQEFWEIKADEQAVDEETARRTRLLIGALPNHGYSYRLVLGVDLAKGPYLANALVLLRYGREEVPALERERLRLLFQEAGELTWRHVWDGLAGERGRQHICRLILEGILIFDMSRLFDDDTCLRWAVAAGK